MKPNIGNTIKNIPVRNRSRTLWEFKTKIQYNYDFPICRWYILVIYKDVKYNEEAMIQEHKSLHKKSQLPTRWKQTIVLTTWTSTWEEPQNKHIEIRIYRKSSSNPIVILRKSRHLHHKKLNKFSCLIHRLTNLSLTANKYKVN